MITNAVQQAVYDRLTGYSAVSSAITGVYTKAPQSTTPESPTPFPYITLGSVSVTPEDTKDNNGAQVLVDVHLWSRDTPVTWRAILSDIYAALHHYALPVTGANVIDCRLDSSVDFADPEDAETWHAVQTFRVSYYILKPELVVGGAWDLGVGTTQSGNQFTMTDAAVNALSRDNDLLTVGVNYEYVLSVTAISSGTVRFGNDTTILREVSATGTYAGSFTAAATQARLTPRDATTNATFTLSIRGA